MNNHKLENWEIRDFIKFLQHKFRGDMRSYYMYSGDNGR